MNPIIKNAIMKTQLLNYAIKTSYGISSSTITAGMNLGKFPLWNTIECMMEGRDGRRVRGRVRGRDGGREDEREGEREGGREGG